MLAISRRSLALSMLVSVAGFAVLLSADLALAQQVPPPLIPAPSASRPMPSANDAYRKGAELSGQKNYTEAMRWYRLAADQGNADAQLAVGDLYGEGQGVHQDYAAALLWYRKAAEQGNLVAEDNVGFFYLAGMGVAQDYGEAMRWLRKAADQGNGVAERNIGMMYLQGLGVPPSRDEAIRWFRNAAAHGDDDSKAALHSLGEK